jgi:hypothetical protein
MASARKSKKRDTAIGSGGFARESSYPNKDKSPAQSADARE